MTRLTVLAALTVAALTGCGMTPGKVADPVSVKGQVTYADGKPVKDVTLSLQPTNAGAAAGLDLGADGTFSGNVVPGKYAYFFTARDGKTDADKEKFQAALKALPEKFRSAHLERTVEIPPAGGDVPIKLN